MTETEVLNKLSEFKNAIIDLKDKENLSTLVQENMQVHIDKLQEKIEEFEKKEELLSKRILELQNTNGSLTDNIDKLKIELEEEKQKNKSLEEKDNDKKYTEEDLKKLLHKASETSKQKIETLTKSVGIYEKDLQNLNEKYNNLEITNRSLENKIKEMEALKEIDQVLDGKITNSEIDQVLKQTSVVHPAEEQIEQMISEKPRIVRMKV